MNDIVGRLRRYAGPLCISTPAEMEAADEIERLRAELAEAQQQAAAYQFIRAGGTHIGTDEEGTAWVFIARGENCETPDGFDAVIFAAMENDNG